VLITIGDMTLKTSITSFTTMNANLFVFDEKIELRSDRENVFSANKKITHQIQKAEDIHMAYRHFWSLTAEDEEEY
jgi:uncharacterized protein (UPF0218 family)